MTAATYPIADQSASVVRHNMVRIKLLTVAGPLLCHTAQRNRVVRLLENRRAWGIEPPLVMLAVHSNDEMAAAKQFQSDVAGDLAQYVIVRQKGHNETVRGSGSCGPESSLCEAYLRPETPPCTFAGPS
jgi:hypothetical protein